MLEFVVVTDDDKPLGVISKYSLLDQIEDETSKMSFIDERVELLKLKSCLIVDHNWPLHEIIKRFSRRVQLDLYDPLIVVDDLKIVGQIPAFVLTELIIKSGEFNDTDS